MSNIQNILAELIQERDRMSQAIAALQSLNTNVRTITGSALLRKKPSHGVKRKVSALARRRMAQAQRARWAKVRKGPQLVSVGKASGSAPKRTLSIAARRKIAAAQRARWARVRAAKK